MLSTHGILTLSPKLCLAVCFVLIGQNICAQETSPDSSEQILNKAVYYTITKTRLIRWARATGNSDDKQLLGQVVEMLEEAETFANASDYETAQLYIDTGLEISRESGKEKDETTLTLAPTQQHHKKSRSQFFPEITTGFDFWRQEFELGFLSVNDTTFFESAGNPYTGLKLRSNHTTKALGNISANFLAKASRDYVSGDFDFRQQAGKLSGSHWGFENRLEWTRYRNGLTLEFFENTALAKGGIELSQNILLSLSDELKIRRYKEETDLFPNYFQNIVNAGLQYQSGFSTRFGGRYSFAARSHPAFSLNDYNEHRVEASLSQAPSANFSIALESNLYLRDYTSVSENFDTNVVDSFRFLRKDYRENYSRADFRLSLQKRLSLQVYGDFNQRNHDFADEITPDYRNLTANPRLLVKLSRDAEIGVGYLFVSRTYRVDATPASVGGQNSDGFQNDIFLASEDFYSHGFSLSFDFFKAGKFMINLTNNFEVRTYPNSVTSDIANFGLYTDRVINSIFLFGSWQALPRLDLNIIANYDQDRSRKQQHSDSRNTLFSLDLGYRLK